MTVILPLVGTKESLRVRPVAHDIHVPPAALPVASEQVYQDPLLVDRQTLSYAASRIAPPLHQLVLGGDHGIGVLALPQARRLANAGMPRTYSGLDVERSQCDQA